MALTMKNFKVEGLEDLKKLLETASQQVNALSDTLERIQMLQVNVCVGTERDMNFQQND